MKNDHALAALERELKRAAFPRPPSFRGSKMNYTRRAFALESWYRHQAGHVIRTSQQAGDRAALGAFHGWITAARAELAAQRRTAKAQAALRHAAGKVATAAPASNPPRLTSRP